MCSVKHYFISIIFFICCSNTFAKCSICFPTHDIIFQTNMQYYRPEIKANPYISVFIQGKRKNFIVDTGSNRHIAWDPAFLSGLETKKRKTHTIHSITEETVTDLVISDSANHFLSQEIGIMKRIDTPLMRFAAGLISPQLLAGKNPFVLDFKQGCFTVLRKINIDQFRNYPIYRGHLINNSYQLMLVPIYLRDKKIIVNVDSGARTTSLLSSLIESFPLDYQKSSEQSIDLLGKSSTKKLPFRQIDFSLNRLVFNQIAVRENNKRADANEIKIMGRIGINVLKDFVIIADFKDHVFHLLLL